MFSIKGTVSSGMNKASNFMNKDVYKKQYSEKLGFIPYTGTLNIKLKNNVTLDIENELKPYLKKIEGDEKFGDVFFLDAVLQPENININKKGAILFPVKTIYKTDTLEFISDEKLRDRFSLVDGDQVIIKIDK
ncbi:MAG: DUF120 domain-containing protein [Methanosphaera stadtmanae]|nr:DUF120 domain-containing protein [Methanosphaera stadtmanae]